MKQYKFIKDTEPENGQIEYLAVSETQIETKPLANCYDHYGQMIGSDTAGDHLSLNTQNAVDFANQKWAEDNEDGENKFHKFNIGDCVSACDSWEVFRAVNNKYEAPDITLEQVTEEVIEYHDGHNWRTKFLSGEAPDYELINDEELESELNKAIHDMVATKEQGGFSYYDSEKYHICQSRWQGDFEIYRLTLK